jgi:Family of unknown function (DUF5719)
VPRGEDRGLAGVACGEPGTEFWFVGAGASPGRRDRLHLVNADSTSAVVSVTLFGERGPVRAPAVARLVLGPGERQVLLVDALAPGVPVLGLRVAASEGRVAAAVRSRQVAGIAPRGLDWLPPAAPPASRHVVAGVPAGSATLALTVLAPGDRATRVRLSLLGAGPRPPAGPASLEVPAGSVRRLDLTTVAGTGPVAVALDADQPVTAGIELTRRAPDGTADTAFAAAAVPLPRPAVLPYADSGVPGTRTTVLLTAPGDATSVRVRRLVPGPNPSPAEQTVSVPAQSTVSATLPAAAGGTGYALVLIPAAPDRVVAAALVDETGAAAPFFTLAVPVPARSPVRLPAVRLDWRAGLPPP